MMTAGELIKALKRYDENMVVEIRVHNPSVGPSRGTNIKSISKGIDWDNNRLFIYPEKHLVEVI
jgi:hypothetical protein